MKSKQNLIDDLWDKTLNLNMLWIGDQEWYTDLLKNVKEAYWNDIISDEWVFNSEVITLLEYESIAMLLDTVSSFIEKTEKTMFDLLTSTWVVETQEFGWKYSLIEHAEFKNRNFNEVKRLYDHLDSLKSEWVIKGCSQQLADKNYYLNIGFHYPPVRDLCQIELEDWILSMTVDKRITNDDLLQAINYVKKISYELTDATGIPLILFWSLNSIEWRELWWRRRVWEEKVYSKYGIPYVHGLKINDTREIKEWFRNMTKKDYEKSLEEERTAWNN